MLRTDRPNGNDLYTSVKVFYFQFKITYLFFDLFDFLSMLDEDVFVYILCTLELLPTEGTLPLILGYLLSVGLDKFLYLFLCLFQT